MTHDRHETKTSKVQEKRHTDDKKREKVSPPSKVVIRRLPASLTPETFLEQVSPVPKYDFFYFVKADFSLGQNAFTRAYINFQNAEEMYNFRDKFDGYIFVDSKGNEFPAIVEYSPFQKVPKKKAKKPDLKKGTIEQDSDYVKFLESIENPECEPTPTIESYLEEIEQRERDMKANHGCLKQTTPLIEYIKRRREEKKVAIQKFREDRKRRELERRRLKEEEKRKRREKEKYLSQKEKEKEKAKEKDKDARDKEKDDDAHSEDQQVKVLRNPERDKDREKDKDRDTPRGKDDKPTGRESLRFSKENRERERAKNEKHREGERPKSGGRGTDKGRPGKDDQERSYEKSRPGREDRDKPRPYREDRREDRPRSAKNERDRDSTRDDRPRSGFGRKGDSYYDERPPRGYKDDHRKRSGGGGDRYDDRPPRGYQDDRKRGSDRYDDKPRSGGSDKRRDDKREDRDRPKSGSKVKSEDVKKQDNVQETDRVKKEVDGGKPERERHKADYQTDKNKEDSKSQVRPIKSGSQSDAWLSGRENAGKNGQKNNDRGESEAKQRKRRDRPERQIYVPRRAREIQKQEAVKEGKEDKGQSSGKDDPDKGQG